jgi:hypothetical protein
MRMGFHTRSVIVCHGLPHITDQALHFPKCTALDDAGLILEHTFSVSGFMKIKPIAFDTKLY